MKWQYLLVGLLLLGCVAGVGAVRENFQSWGSTVIGNSGGSPAVNLYAATNGSVGITGGGYYSNIDPTTFTYAAVDTPNGDTLYMLYLLDSGRNVVAYGMRPCGGYAGSRCEMKIIGGDPTFFLDGVQKAVWSSVSITPSYFSFELTNGNNYFDNVLIGGTDHHVVGALPSNWTIQRDLINPSATGVYAWNPTTSTRTLMNSHYFYIDADTDSTDAIYTENFDIVNYQTGLTVNTTVIDSTIPRHQLQYDINQFLSTPVGLYSQLPDGMYVARFRGYTDSQVYFWIISSGASISWDKSTYASGDAATITYAVSNSYWNTATYGYKVAIMNTAGTFVKNTTVTSQTGTVSIASLTSTTYPAGTYYAEMIATSSSGEYVMGYAGMDVTDYVYVTGGYVMNETGAILTGANVTVSQGSTAVSYNSASTGWGNTTQYWLTGSTVTVLTNKSGYINDIRSFIPYNAGSIILNITLFSTTPTYSGAAIGGIVRDDQYGNPVVGATYHTLLGTDTTCTTNIAGACINNNLVANALYNVSGSKTGYGNSTYHEVTAVGV